MSCLLPVAPGAATTPELSQRLSASGPEGLDDAEALQLASGASPEQVRALLDEFGSLPQVLAASPAALRRFVRPAAAGRLVLARDLAQRLLRAPLRERPVLSSWSALVDYLRAGLAGRSRERFHVLYLDKRNRLIRDEIEGEGTVDHAPVYPREILRRALELDASALILAHNHPAGDPAPSVADVDMTRQVVEAARALRISVHDHVVVSGQGVASFRALGLL
ncbi:JAB domain-containing protein [Phenylobacterium sp.]|uniref:JAB domain-containing protein n=1 Tax=Phenylobacterium sp. TaxID=1871053 RepID=UPI003BA95758